MRTAFGRQLYRYRDRDPDLAFVRFLLKPGDVFVDGGAHVGMFTLVAARAVGPMGQVHAFEPHPATFEMLRCNIDLNGFGNVHLHCEAIGEQEGEAVFEAIPGDRAPWSHITGTSEGRDGNCIRVKVASLAESVPKEVWEKIALMKLDLEGYELHALRGAGPLLDQVRPDLLVEVVPEHLERSGATAMELMNELQRYGYVLFRRSNGTKRWHEIQPDEALAVPSDSPNAFATQNRQHMDAAGCRRDACATIGAN
jgi:FkbM family methyltransferase